MFKEGDDMKKSFIENKLKEYGFKYIKKDNHYLLKKNILDEKMQIKIFIKNILDMEIATQVFDILTQEEYVLYKIPTAHGEFTTKIRKEIETVLEDIYNKCYFINNNLEEQKDKVLEYALKKYGTPPEFLWKKSPDSFILRRMDNKKWYAVFMKILKNRIIAYKNYKDDEKIYVLNVRVNSEDTQKIISEHGFYPAYHMNKKNWVSISLDNTVDIHKIFQKIDESYNLVLNKKGD